MAKAVEAPATRASANGRVHSGAHEHPIRARSSLDSEPISSHWPTTWTTVSVLVDIDQSKVDLVNERRRLKGVPRRFTAKMAARHPAQFVVDERDQAVERRGVSLAPGQEQVRYIVHAERSIISS